MKVIERRSGYQSRSRYSVYHIFLLRTDLYGLIGRRMKISQWQNGSRRLIIRLHLPTLRVWRLLGCILRLDDFELANINDETYPSITSEYVSGSFLIASTTTFLRSRALSIPPRKTTPTAEKRHELSSGTFLNSSHPLFPGNSTLTPSPDLPPPPGGGVGACDAGCGVNRPGADNAALRGLIDGAGVGSLDADGIDGLADWD